MACGLNKWIRIFWASLAAPFLLVIAALVLETHAWEPRKPILYGSAQRPFPAFFHIDYPLARAEAWLKAINMAEKRVPDTANTRRLGIKGRLARDTVAALFYPVDVVTPENASGKEIRVFLKDEPAAGVNMDSLLAEPFPFFIKMCLVWEMADASAKLRRIWPPSVDAGRKNAAELETLGNHLENLWRIWHEPDKPIPDDKDSVAALLLKAMANPGSTSSLEQASRAINLLMKRETEARGNAALWSHLMAYALYCRSMGEIAQSQPGLAQAGIDAALLRLKKSIFPDSLAPKLLLERAALHQRQGNIQAMCADYLAACGFGQCQGLAAARRRGECAAR